MSELQIVLFSCLAAMLGGYADLLRSNKPHTLRNVRRALVWNAAIGAGIGCGGASVSKARPYLVIATSLFVAMGLVPIEAILNRFINSDGGKG